jgi:hypothetical protein
VTEATFWNGEPAEAKRVTLEVADSSFPLYWAREFVGQRRDAVEVTYADTTFWLDDEGGHGWDKVTVGMGSPGYGHRNLRPAPGSVVDRDTT